MMFSSAMLPVLCALASLFAITNADGAAATTSWGYNTENGDKLAPYDWAKAVVPDGIVNQCGGKRNSPIDIQNNIAKSCKKLRGGSKDATITLGEDSLELEGKTYKFAQLHCHVVSEHTMNGEIHDAELHLVHATDDTLTDLLVIGVFMDAAGFKQNEKLEKMITQIVSGQKAVTPDFLEQCGIKPYDLLPASKSYYQYSGSLTTVPCSEVVTWVVMQQAVKISNEQLQAYRNYIGKKPDFVSADGNDNRPVVELNGREITKCNM